MCKVMVMTTRFRFARHSCYDWKWPFLAKKNHTKQKNIHNSAKTYDTLINKKFVKAYDLVFVISLRKLFFVLGTARGGPFLHELGPKMVIYQISFKTTGLQWKLLILIESPNIFYWKTAKIDKVFLVLG